jgi:hypothetical protein
VIVVPQDENADREAFWDAARAAFIKKGPSYIVCVIGTECEIKLDYLREEVFLKQSTLSVVAEFGALDRWAEFDQKTIVLTLDMIVEVKVHTFSMKLSDKNGN